MDETQVITSLGTPRRIWTVGPVHGEVERLNLLHQHLAANLTAQDGLVYLGDYLGWGAQVCETVDELLSFRCDFLARPHFKADNLVYLRGAQEEMWQKLLQLQFASDPVSILQWIAARGGEATIRAYGGRLNDGLKAANDGVLSLTRWTGALRQSMRSHDGHTVLMGSLMHAATTEPGENETDRLLFVHAGLDPARPLNAQGDYFWWGSPAFDRLSSAYGGFRRVIRGTNPQQRGLQVQPFSVSLDGGCGQGGTLICACFAPDGEILQAIEV